MLVFVWGCTAPRPASIEVVLPDTELSTIDGVALVEPRPAVHPLDPDHLVVGAIAARPVGRDSGWTCHVLTTLDGGDSWHHGDLGLDRCIDPWVTFASPDTVVFAAIEIARDAEDESRFRAASFLSSDGGRTWTGPNDLGRGFEHPMLTAHGGSVLLLGRRMLPEAGRPTSQLVHISRSSDGGATFDPLSEARPPGTGPGHSEITPTGVAVRSDRGIIAAATGGGRAWSMRLSEDLRSFDRVTEISDRCAGGGQEASFAGWPYFTGAPDGSRLYHACVRARFEGVEVRHSPDGGATWSGPSVLGGAPADGEPTVGDVRTAMLEVNRDGVVAVAWHDRSLGEPGCQRVLVTASVDGGTTWIPPVTVSTEPSCPGRGENAWIAESWPMGGDYSSLVADGEGRFHLVWADSRDGVFALRRVMFRVTG